MEHGITVNEVRVSPWDIGKRLDIARILLRFNMENTEKLIDRAFLWEFLLFEGEIEGQLYSLFTTHKDYESLEVVQFRFLFYLTNTAKRLHQSSYSYVGPYRSKSG